MANKLCGWYYLIKKRPSFSIRQFNAQAKYSEGHRASTVLTSSVEMESSGWVYFIRSKSAKYEQI